MIKNVAELKLTWKGKGKKKSVGGALEEFKDHYSLRLSFRVILNINCSVQSSVAGKASTKSHRKLNYKINMI